MYKNYKKVFCFFYLLFSAEMIITSAKIKPQDLSQQLKNLSVFFVLNQQKLENKNETCDSLMGEYLANHQKFCQNIITQ